MPELPEVETVRVGLTKYLIGKKITSICYDWPKSFPNSQPDTKNFIENATVISIKRRAKVLLIELDSDYTLVIHLKMTGQLVYRSDKNRFGAGHPNDSLIGDLPDKSTRVTVTFSDQSKLYFNDQRKFGWIRLIPTVEVPSTSFFKKIGPEPLEAAFTNKILLKQLMKRPNTTIKAALLDQTVIAGIGNIYADESLWGAMIHPKQLVKNLTQYQVNTLFNELQYVLRLSIKKGGSTDRNYVNADGKRGSYMDFVRVFRRENQRCPRCHSVIEKIRVASRGTHICPTCQKVN